MKRFVEGTDRSQSVLFPEHLDDYVVEDNIVRIVEAFIEALDLKGLGFAGAEPARTGRPSYHPAVLLGSTSTATSIVSSPADAWSAKHSAMSN